MQAILMVILIVFFLQGLWTMVKESLAEETGREQERILHGSMRPRIVWSWLLVFVKRRGDLDIRRSEHAFENCFRKEVRHIVQVG
jgi:hypothetical protein